MDPLTSESAELLTRAERLRRQLEQHNNTYLINGGSHRVAAVAFAWELRRMIDIEPEETRPVLRQIVLAYIGSSDEPASPTVLTSRRLHLP